MKNIEYERKFLFKEYPLIIDQFKYYKIKQWYLTKPDDDLSIRIRLYDDNRCYMDFKKGKGIERYEYGIKCIFDDIKPLTENMPFIEKGRFSFRTEDYLLIIDEFDNGLKLIEIECNSLEYLKNFKPFKWMGKEVTNDIKYTNHWISFNKKGEF